MPDCPAKRLSPELIRVCEAAILKKLVLGTIGEMELLENNPDIPACVKLLARVLLDDSETGRADTINDIVVYRFNCKTVGELLCRHRLLKAIPG
jgi:hypothetical protein